MNKRRRYKAKAQRRAVLLRRRALLAVRRDAFVHMAARFMPALAPGFPCRLDVLIGLAAPSRRYLGLVQP